MNLILGDLHEDDDEPVVIRPRRSFTPEETYLPWEVMADPGEGGTCYMVVQKPVDPNRRVRTVTKHNRTLWFGSKDAALSRCLQENMEQGRIKRHAFEPGEPEGRKAPRCKHCGLPSKHVRAHVTA